MPIIDNTYFFLQVPSLPLVIHNEGGVLTPGGLLQITPDLLQVKVTGQSSADVIYSLVPTLNNPQKGRNANFVY